MKRERDLQPSDYGDPTAWVAGYAAYLSAIDKTLAWFNRSEKENPTRKTRNSSSKVTLANLYQSARFHAANAAAPIYEGKGTAAPSQLKSDFADFALKNGLSKYGKPVQKSVKDRYETTWWRAASKGFGAVTDRSNPRISYDLHGKGYHVVDSVTGETIGNYTAESGARKDQKVFNAGAGKHAAVGEGYLHRYIVARGMDPNFQNPEQGRSQYAANPSDPLQRAIDAAAVASAMESTSGTKKHTDFGKWWLTYKAVHPEAQTFEPEQVMQVRAAWNDVSWGGRRRPNPADSVTDIVTVEMAGARRGADMLRTTGVSPSKLAAETIKREFEIWWEYEAPKDSFHASMTKAEALKHFKQGFSGKRRHNPGEKITGTRAIGTRMGNADLWAYGIIESKGFSAADAHKILKTLIKHKLLKIDITQGRYNAASGEVWDHQVLQRALEEANSPGKWTKRKGNPESGAAALFEKFHGRPSEEILEIIEDVHVHDDLAALGEFVELEVHTVTGLKLCMKWDPKKDALSTPILSSSEDGRQLYLRGGDQSIDLASIKMDNDKWLRDKMLIGEVHLATYRTQKEFDDFEDVDYFHKLGEKTKVRPSLVYDSRSQLMEFVGGQYHIDLPLIGVSRGIMN